MKKFIKVLFSLLLVLILVGCQTTPPPVEKFTVEFVDRNYNLLASVEVEKGLGLSEYPEVEVEEGHYYSWDKTLEELSNIQEDIAVLGVKKEYYKDIKYFIDNEEFYHFIGLYTKTYTVPKLDSKYENTSWTETKNELVGDRYYIEYKLEYTLKTTFNISYYDGTTKLELSPATFTLGQDTVLPTPEKAGYKFVGWFASSLSLTQYSVINSEFNSDISLHARFIEVEKQNLITLPETKYHFTSITRNYNSSTNTYTYNPVFPSGVNSSATQYDWSTSDSSIATVSKWSSISIKKGGYCVLTATSISNPSLIVNAVIKVSADGVSVSNVDEANTVVTHTVTFVDKDNQVLSTQTVIDGQFAIAPKPPVCEGLAFNGWDKEYFNVKADLTVKATYVSGTNNYAGKTFSFIGDSISTYQDYVPEGYATFYPYPTADVNDVNQTWWMQVCNKIGASLYIDNSYSGSCVAGSAASRSSNPQRLQKLSINGKSSDVIIIFMGSNDAGNNSGITPQAYGEAYKKMLDYIYDICGEEVEIILCTLPTSKLYSDARKVSFNEVIVNMATEYSLEVVDFASLDLTPHLIDSAHPQTSGMTVMANKVLEKLLEE